MLGISDHNGPSHAVWVCGWASLDRKSLHIFLLLVPIVVLLLTLQHTHYSISVCIALHTLRLLAIFWPGLRKAFALVCI